MEPAVCGRRRTPGVGSTLGVSPVVRRTREPRQNRPREAAGNVPEREFVLTRGSFDIQHVAEGKSWGKKPEERELRVIKSWVSTYFVIVRRKFAFANEAAATKASFTSEDHSKCRACFAKDQAGFVRRFGAEESAYRGSHGATGAPRAGAGNVHLLSRDGESVRMPNPERGSTSAS